MKKILLSIVLMMIGLTVSAQQEFYFTGIETTGASQNLNYQATEPAAGGLGDHSDMKIIINPEVDNPDNISFSLTFNEDAYIKMFADVPQIGQLEIYSSDSIVESPLTATSSLLSMISQAPDGDYGLIVTGSTQGEPTTEPDSNNPNKEVLKFTVTVDSEMGIEAMDFNGFSYYPNPIGDQLNLKATSNIDKVSIYNVLGQQVLTVNPNRLETQLNSSSLQSGIYIMKVEIDGSQKSFKIVKK